MAAEGKVESYHISTTNVISTCAFSDFSVIDLMQKRRMSPLVSDTVMICERTKCAESASTQMSVQKFSFPPQLSVPKRAENKTSRVDHMSKFELFDFVKFLHKLSESIKYTSDEMGNTSRTCLF